MDIFGTLTKLAANYCYLRKVTFHPGWIFLRVFGFQEKLWHSLMVKKSQTTTWDGAKTLFKHEMIYLSTQDFWTINSRTKGTAIEEKGAFSICVPGSFGPADGKASLMFGCYCNLQHQGTWWFSRRNLSSKKYPKYFGVCEYCIKWEHRLRAPLWLPKILFETTSWGMCCLSSEFSIPFKVWSQFTDRFVGCSTDLAS